MQELDLYETVEVATPSVAPVQRAVQGKQQLNWAAVLFGTVCAVLVVMLYFETRKGGDDPVPPTPVNVVDEVASVTVEYLNLLAAGTDEVAGMIEDGKIKTAKEVSDASRQLSEFAKQKTFVEKIGKMDNENIGEEALKPGAAAYLRDVADGHRKAVGK